MIIFVYTWLALGVWIALQNDSHGILDKLIIQQKLLGGSKAGAVAFYLFVTVILGPAILILATLWAISEKL